MDGSVKLSVRNPWQFSTVLNIEADDQMEPQVGRQLRLPVYIWSLVRFRVDIES
jgi:hypothetical protein